ncbi:MAG: peptidylprolyl isomerase [Deltaproteobacteria bacterium]|nr:peptidylprolyl isomerase [Deltaproteobacteria bacterium]
MKKKISCYFIMLVLGVGLGLARAEEINRIVAIVNNEIITFHELQKAVRSLPPSVLTRENSEEIKKQLLFQLIDQKLVGLQIKRLGIQISPEEVDKTVARIKQDQGFTNPDDFAAALKKEGLSETEFKNKVKDQILRFRLVSREIGSKIIIPEPRLREFFEKNKSKFQKTEGIHLAHILLAFSANTPTDEIQRQKEKAEEVLEHLKKGEDFSELARKYSQDSSAAQGGDLGIFISDEIESSVREAISTLKPGEFSQVIQSPQGWQIVKLIANQGAGEVAFEEVRDRITEQLFQEEVDLRFSQWLQQLKDRSYIQILL